MNFKEATQYINNFIKDVQIKDKNLSGASFVFENVTEKDLEILAFHYIGEKYEVKTRYTEDIEYDSDFVAKYKTTGDIYIKW